MENIASQAIEAKDLAGDSLQSAVRIDEGQIRSHLDQLVRSTVEQTLNSMLDAEADALCGAKRYERSPDRVDT